MKKIIAFLLCLTMAVGLAACGASPAPAAPAAAPAADAPAAAAPAAPAAAPAAPANDFTATLKIGYVGNDETTTSKYIVKWAEDVKEKTGGRITIETYSSGQLGTGVEMIEAVDLGTLDMTLADFSLMETYLPEISVLALPCIIEDYDHMLKAYTGEVGQELFARLENNSNIKLLGDFFYNGFRYIGSVRALNTLEDCKGLIIRSPESDIYVNTFKLYGMNPTPLPLGDVYSALQTNVVEGVDSPIENFINFSFGEVAPFILKSRHLASALQVAVNKNTWGKIPAEDQALIEDSLRAAVAESNAAVMEKEESCFSELEAGGVTFTEFSAEERAALVERFAEYWGTFADKTNCRDLLDKLMNL